MRILQVLTFVGPGNPFGGPASVATNQAAELRLRGNDVVIVAAQPAPALRGAWKPKDVLGFDSRAILRGAGFSGIVSLSLSRYLWRHVREFDIVHVHMSRDLVTIPAALIARLRKVPYVVQTHGMIDASSKKSARLLDGLATRRILSGAQRVFVLTSHEKDDIGSVMGARPVECELLPNGIRVDSNITRDRTADGTPEVLYCARLHHRKRPRAFVQAALDLLRDNVKARFVVLGPDEGELATLEDMLERAGRPEGISVGAALEPEEVSERLDQCSLLVLPSVDEPFPMIILESLAAGRAVVITESCGLAGFVRQNGCGVVVPPDDQMSLNLALRDLIPNPIVMREMGKRGTIAVQESMSIEAVVDQLTASYKSVS